MMSLMSIRERLNRNVKVIVRQCKLKEMTSIFTKKSRLPAPAHTKSSEVSLTTIDFESTKTYQESRPSLKSLKTNL